MFTEFRLLRCIHRRKKLLKRLDPKSEEYKNTKIRMQLLQKALFIIRKGL